MATLVTIALAPAKAAEKAEDYPSRPVRIIVPFGAGGPTDVFTRAIAEELRKSLKQSFVQENKPGAGTTIGTDYVAKAAPDGYTLLMVSGTQTVNETLFNRKPYHLMHDLVAGRAADRKRPGAGRAPFGAGKDHDRAALR